MVTSVLDFLSWILFQFFLRLVLSLTEDIGAKCFRRPSGEGHPLVCQVEAGHCPLAWMCRVRGEPAASLIRYVGQTALTSRILGDFKAFF